MSQVRALLSGLNEDEKIALVRCEADKPYIGDGPIKTLRDLDLVEKDRWRCTELGKEIVAQMCGVPYKAPAPAPVLKNGKLTFRADQELVPAFAQRDCVCGACKEDLLRGEPGRWIQGEGFFHKHCVEKERS